LRGLFCAAALAVSLAPGIRADEYTKQTFLTFSGPVQLPGITLPAGTYQFKLADPEFGRYTLQVWDKDGTKLFTTLLTIPDQQMKPTGEPVVTFAERPSGEAQPIRAWFYPNETFGQEFVYPKDQAMKIARDTHTSVLSFNDDTKDASEYKSARIGRMDENGRMNDTDKSAATTLAEARAGSAPDSSAAQSDASLSRPAQSASAQSAAEPRPSAPIPSADRTEPGAAVGTSGSSTTVPAAADTVSEANRDNIPSNRAVDTTGTTGNAARANRTAQAGAGANAAAPRSGDQPSPTAAAGSTENARTLPHTAGSTTLVLLLAVLSLGAALGLRIIRARSTDTR